MKKLIAILTAWIAVLALAGSLTAHHSLASFDTTMPLRVKGTVVLHELINPHSIIFLDQKKEDGQVQRWAFTGPGVGQIDRMGLSRDVVKAGDSIEICGFAIKEDFPSQRDFKSSPTNMSGRAMNGHVLVMPHGKRRFWSDYGQLSKCLSPGETRESLSR